MKQKRRIWTAILIMTLCIAVSPRIYADDYIKNFSQKYRLSENQFQDISNDAWYVSSVETVYESGIMNGDSESLFNPNGNLTNAEAIAVASRLHKIYNHKTDEFEKSEPWYSSYISYAVNNGICDNNFQEDDAATRAFFVGVVGNAVSVDELQSKNTISDGELYDVNGWYEEAAYRFYRAGVLSGNDVYGTFAPNSAITRAEVSAILARIIKPANRVFFTLYERPLEGTYSIPADDGSLEAYRQRALVANFKVLLDGKEKDASWENDVYYIEHTETTKAKFFVPQSTIYPDYKDGEYVFYIPFSSIGGNNNLRIPIYSKLITGSDAWGPGEKFLIKDKYYYIRFSKKDYGDLIFDEIIPGWTETVTYNNYTAEAQRMIDATYQYSTIDMEEIERYVEGVMKSDNLRTMPATVGSETNTVYSIAFHYLRESRGDYMFITAEDEKIDMPNPELPSKNQKGRRIGELTEEQKEWCSRHIGKLVLCVTKSYKDKPCLLAEIKNYNPNPPIKTWHYDGNTLSIIRNYLDLDFSDALVNSENADNTDTTGLVPVCSVKNSDYENLYYFNFRDAVDDFSKLYFNMELRDNNIAIYREGTEVYVDRHIHGDIPGENTITMTLNSDTAMVNGKNVKITPPRIVDDTIYLPAEFVITNLFKKTLVVADDVYDGLEIAQQIAATDRYYFDDESKWFFMRYDGGEYDYVIYRNKDDGPFIYISVDSDRATVLEFESSTDYEGKKRSVKVKAPLLKYGEELYLPKDFILETLF